MAQPIGILLTLIAISFIGIIQLMSGAKWEVVCALVLSSLLIIPAVSNSRKTGADIILLGFSFYLGLSSLIFKTLMGQKVDSNLIAPVETSVALILSSLSILSAYYLSRNIFRNYKDVFGIGSFYKNPAAVSSIVIYISIISCILYFLHISLHKGGQASGEGFGGFGSFYFLINISLALLYAHVANKKNTSTWFLISGFGAFLLLCSLLSNEKRPIIDFGLVTLLSFIFLPKLRPKLWVLVVITVVAIPSLAMLAGALEATRMEGRDLKPIERAEMTWKLLVDNDFNYSKISEKSSSIVTTFDFVYRPNMSYYYPATANVDRYSLIFPLDQVVREDPKRLPIQSALSEFVEMMPAGLVEKKGISFSDLIAWNFGIRHYGSVARPVLGLPSSAYAVGGIPGVIIIPGIFSFLIFSASILVSGRLDGSPIAIALAIILLVCVENSFARLGAYLIRPIWFIIIPLIVMKFLTRRTFAYRRWERAARSALINEGNQKRSRDGGL